MTDPLIEIAEDADRHLKALREAAKDLKKFKDEMPEPYYRVLGAIDTLEEIVAPWAARIRAFWTPERQVFYEAAIMYAAAVGALRYEPIAESRAFHDAYHALVESERGESEGE